jgi:integrase
VTRAHVAKLHRSIGARTPVTANRVVTLISGLYSWAASVGEVPEDLHPAKGVGRYREEGCERYLSLEEFRRLGVAMRDAEKGLPWTVDEVKPTAKHARKPENRFTQVSPFAIAAIKLLLLTGCRLREILNLQWEHVDFDRGMLFLRDSKTGRKPVLLSPHALAVLEGIPRLGRFVIVGADPDSPRHDLKRPWQALVGHAGLGNVRLHDLRHSFASVGAGAGLGLPIIGRLLGHRSLETTNRYAHLDAHPLRIAGNRVASEVASAIGECTESAKMNSVVVSDL